MLGPIVWTIVGMILMVIILCVIRTIFPVMWKNSEAEERLPDLIAEFGKPDWICKRAGGFAIWSEKTLIGRGFPLVRIEIHDEAIDHLDPEPHKDFLYMAYRMKIPEDKIEMVLGLSKSVYYDRLKNLLWARCHFSGATIATINEAIEIVEGLSTGTQGEYADAIFKTAKMKVDTYDPAAYGSYMKRMKDNRIERYTTRYNLVDVIADDRKRRKKI